MKNDAKQIVEECEKDLIFKTSRSGGSGGQHVNKVETKVTLRWSVVHSEHLTEVQKTTILEKLKSFINKEGELVLHSEAKRSQLKNKEIAVKKWKNLILKAFVKRKVRKKSKPSKQAKEKRIKDKKAKSGIKAARKKPRLDD